MSAPTTSVDPAPPAAPFERILELATPLPPDLCDGCLGRLFARLLDGPDNRSRGATIRTAAGRAAPDICGLCEGLVDRVDAFARACLDAARDVEWSTFLVGTVTFKQVRDREVAIYETLAAADPALARAIPVRATSPPWSGGEWLKNELNRAIGNRVEAATGRRVEFDRPDVTFRVDTRFDHVTVGAADLFVQGRYRKFVRDLPQTRWPCRACQGLGCRQCAGRGTTYDSSVEQLVAAPILAAANAKAEAFHGMGREDIDARTLGNGRPFILELKQPLRRDLPLAELEQRINAEAQGKIEVLGLAPARPGDAAVFKAAEADKSYRARCQAAAAVTMDALTAALSALVGVELDQRTPQRVSHRRADLVRRRQVQSLELLQHDGDRFEIEIRADSGTYIKEFVSGDEGRTRPSLAERLGVACRVTELDVVAVHWPDPSSASGVGRANA